MNLRISNKLKSKKSLLTITLIINYCASLYLASSNASFGSLISLLTLGMSLAHAFLYIYFNRSNQNIMIWIVIYALLFFAYRHSQRREVLDLFVYASYYGNTDYKEINKVFLRTSSVFFVSVIVLSFLHIIPNAPAFYRGEVYRFTLGLIHPNAGGYFSLMIASSLFVKYYNTKKKETIVILMILLAGVYYLFNNRSSTICIMIIIIAYSVNLIGYDIGKKMLKSKIIRLLLALSIIAIAYVLIKVSNDVGSHTMLNALLSARIENNNMFLQEYSVKLFGNPDVPTWMSIYDGWGVRYLDSGYIQCLLMLGVVNSIAYIYIFVKSMMWNIRQKRTEVVVLLVIIALLLVVEASPLRWYFAMPLLFQSSERLCLRWKIRKRQVF